MMLTRIAAGQRADAVPNGWERLAGKKAAEAKVEYENAVAYLKTNPTAKKYMDAALLEYKQFNSGLLDFAEQHDLLSAEEVARLKKTPFVPFYRVEDGVGQAVLGFRKRYPHRRHLKRPGTRPHARV